MGCRVILQASKLAFPAMGQPKIQGLPFISDDNKACN
jgi:hypothetical protein